MIPDSAPLTQRAFAEYMGVSQTAVSRAVRAGRLVKSINAEGRIINAELAKQEWEAHTDLSKAPGYVRECAEARKADQVDEHDAESDEEPPSLAEASAREKHWRAKLAELKYREEAGKLVRARDVAARLEHAIAGCKTKLLAIPSRARQQDPGLTVAQVALFEALIREALEELASGGTTA